MGCGQAIVFCGEMMQLRAMWMDSESGSEHELKRSDCRTRCLTGYGVQGERHPGQFLGFGNMGLNSSLFSQT